MKVTDFGKVTVRDARDRKQVVTLESFWTDSPCAFFFLRRLGCSICRSYIKIIDTIRNEYEQKGIRLVAFSFEAIGTGSDSDGSFEAGGFWKGPLYTIDKSVYEALFGRKGLFDNFYGLLDIDKEAYKRAKGTPGNFKGDGFQLGGQFVVKRGGEVVLDRRQKAFGDDAPVTEIVEALDALR
jgi:prostamide/prostaglandin F2alpha synthase